MQALPGDPPWLTKAAAEIGFHEKPGNQGTEKYVQGGKCGAVGEPWCASFANYGLETVGISGTRSAMARSFEHDTNFTRLAEPKRGCIVVFWRVSPASGSGHVTFCTEIAGGKIRGLGGNQSDGVCEEWFSTEKVTGFFWPASSIAPAANAPIAKASDDPEFDRMQAGYRNLWLRATIRPEFAAEANAIAAKLKAGQPRYEAFVKQFPGMPWWAPALINNMESGEPFKGHLFNGDSLNGYTHNEPAGQPNNTGHGPPFTWEESAAAALRHDGLDKVTDWSIPRFLFEAEVHYNGRGYFKRNVNSPYVWCGTSEYGDSPNIGKFVSDGVYDPNYVSKQIGVACIMKAIGLDLALPDLAAPDPTVSHGDLQDLQGDVFKGVQPGRDNIPLIRSRLNVLFGGDWVGGLNQMFGPRKS